MKELSIEEKAKRYDEAIEKARKIHNEQKAQPFNVMLKVFPELKDIEDERIRESLLEYLHTLPNHYAHSGVCAPEWIAWLEKQGEQESADKVEPKFKVGDVVINKKSKDTVKIVQILHDSYCYSGWDGAATVYSDFSISKQDDWELVELTGWSEEGGQKYSEDSCKKSDDIAAEEKAEYKKGFECGKQLVLKYPEDFDLCKKTLTDWSEEDEEMMSSTVFYLNEYKEVYQEGAQKCISWLKSLKERVKPQQEWSDEDDYNLQCCIAKVQSDIDNGRIGRNRELLTWLKSLKPQDRWEPSEEQMDALSSIIATCSDTERGNYLRDMLINLYNDLKKL